MCDIATISVFAVSAVLSLCHLPVVIIRVDTTISHKLIFTVSMAPHVKVTEKLPLLLRVLLPPIGLVCTSIVYARDTPK
jgi:hypothetical protein